MKTFRRNSSGLFDIPRIYLRENRRKSNKSKEPLYAALKILKVEFIRWRCWISWKLWEVSGSDKLPVLVQHGLLCGSRCMMYRVHVVWICMCVSCWPGEMKKQRPPTHWLTIRLLTGSRRLGWGLDWMAAWAHGPDLAPHLRPLPTHRRYIKVDKMACVVW